MPTQKSFKNVSLLLFCIAVSIWWLFSSFQTHYTTDQPSLDVWMLDVGQGESILLRDSSGKKLLYDGGPDDSVLSELGSILAPWDRHIDMIVLSHNHSDHIRGLISVLDRYDVGELWISGAIHTTDDYKTFLETVKDHSTTTKIKFFDPTTCTEICPPITNFGNSQIQVYHPLNDMTGQLPKNQHDATVSVKVSFKDESIFLTGDLHEDQEQEMIEACPPPNCTLASTILQIPHHGSASGLSPEFLKAVNPEFAFIPVGVDNKFNHPRQEIIEKLNKAKIPIYRTDTEGRIHAVLDGDPTTFDISKSK